MKKIILVLAMVSTSLFFTSCEKDTVLEDAPEKQTNLRRNTACGAATNITTTVDGVAVEIGFDAVASGTSHLIFFRKVGDTNFTNFTTLVKAASISNLEKNTEYEFYVRTLCGSIGANNSEIIKFKTGDADFTCARVVGLASEDLNHNSVLVKFGAVYGADRYLINYKGPEDKFSKAVFSNIASMTLTGLTPNTTYEVTAQAMCTEAGGKISAPIEIKTTGASATGCAAPTNVTATADGTAVTVLFDASSSENATQYIVGFRKTGSTEIYKGFTTYVNGGAITTLEPNTEYDVRVRAVCKEIGSNDNPIIKVKTGAETKCASVVRLNVDKIGDNSARLRFGTVEGRDQYMVLYRKVGAQRYISKTEFFTSHYLEDLEPGTEYEAKARALCGPMGLEFSNTVTFKTTGTSCTGMDVGLKLTLDNYGSETSFELKKADGTVVKTENSFKNGTNGQVYQESFNLPNGTYELVIKDSYGDGICCDYGNGSFDLVDASGKVIQAFDGNFGTKKKVSFTVENCKIGAISVQKDAKRRMRGKKK